MPTTLVHTDRGAVEYTDAGGGRPVLYFHGAGVTGDAMIPVESPLIDAGFRLIVPNRPGYRKTPLSPNNTAKGCADVAAALLDALSLTQVSVMGSSGGAAFALAFALSHPARTRSVVLLCPQLHRWSHKKWLPVNSRWTLPFLKRRFLRKLLLSLYRLQLACTSVEQFLKTQAGDRLPEIANDPHAKSLCAWALAAMARGVRYPGFENDFIVFTTEDIFQTGRALQRPALIIHDATDPLAPVDHVDWFVSIVPECERVTVRAGGHLIWAGPEARVMHESRIRFLKRHCFSTGNAEPYFLAR